MANQSTIAQDLALLTLLAAIFGASFIFTGIAVKTLSPTFVAMARLGLATLMLYPFMRLSGARWPVGWRIWGIIVAAGFFGNALPFSLISWGQVQVDAGLTAIFMAIMPLFTVLLAHLLTDDEKMNGLKLVGVSLGLFGVIVLIGWDELAQVGEEKYRQYAILLGALCYSINAILTKYLTGLPRLSMMTALTLVATLMLLPVTLWISPPWSQQFTVSSGLALLFLAVGPTALATLLILEIIDRRGASFLSQINFMVPLFGVLFGWLFLDERLPGNAWLALGFILAGVWLSRMGSRSIHSP